MSTGQTGMRRYKRQARVALLRLGMLAGAALALLGCSEPPAAVQARDVPAAGATGTATQQPLDVLPVPTMARCASSDKPLLPNAWQTGAVLQHFSSGELVVGNIVYDAAAAATRFTLIGMGGGSADYLLTGGGNLFILSGGYPQPTQCELVAKTSLAVPTRSWNKDGSICVGEAPVAGVNLAWWKQKVAEPLNQPAGANWFWYRAAQQSVGLFRTMFQKPSNDFGIVGQFALSYFPAFREVGSTNIASLMNLCRNATTPTKPGFDPGSVTALLAANSIPRSQQDGLIGTWAPGLGRSDVSTPPPWPDRVAATAFMVSVNYCYSPFPTRVFYDWPRASQNTTMFWNQNAPAPQECPQNPFFDIKALLYGPPTPDPHPTNTGYAIPESVAIGPISCAQALPGLPRPNWMKYGGCETKARIAPNGVLNPRNEALKIVHCPIKPADSTPAMAFWAWYFESGTPLAFMQTNATTGGTGLNLADYYQWKPGAVAPASTYHLPALCNNRPKIPDETGCHKCHMPTQQN